MATDDDFRHESVQDRQSIVRYLHALTAGIEKGHLELGTAERMLALDPAGPLELEVRAKRKSGRVSLSIRLHWREQEPEQPSETLHIKG